LDTEKADNSDAARVVDRSETSIDKIMILGVEVGVHRHRDLRLSGERRWRNGMLMLRKGLALLLVVERTGKRQKGLGDQKF